MAADHDEVDEVAKWGRLANERGRENALLRAENERLREFADFALEVLAIGGNGEGWTLNDAVSALRVALGEEGVNERWREPLSEQDWGRLVAFIGEPAAALRGEP